MTSQRPSVSQIALPFVFLIVIAAASACSGRVRNEVVTEANRDAVSARVAQSSLSDDDKSLFVSFLQRVDAADAHGRWADTNSPYAGKTVSAIIEEERGRRTAERTVEAQRATSAAAVKSGGASVTAAIGKVLSVSVVDTRVAQFGVLPYSYIKLVAENRSAKDTAGFAGHLTIRDKFGDEVAHVSIDVTQSITSGAKMTWEELVTDVTTSPASATHLKFDWAPNQVVFRDGTQIGPVKASGPNEP